jgi:hypothetical protein
MSHPAIYVRNVGAGGEKITAQARAANPADTSAAENADDFRTSRRDGCDHRRSFRDAGRNSRRVERARVRGMSVSGIGVTPAGRSRLATRRFMRGGVCTSVATTLTIAAKIAGPATARCENTRADIASSGTCKQLGTTFGATTAEIPPAVWMRPNRRSGSA